MRVLERESGVLFDQRNRGPSVADLLQAAGDRADHLGREPSDGPSGMRSRGLSS
jgi:hypothetical protein